VPIDRHELRSVAGSIPWIAPRIQDERVDPSGLRVADPDPLLPAGVLHIVGLRVRHVDLILAVERNSARLSELRPRSRQRLPLLIEDLDPVVPAVADENSSPRVDSDGVESMELARRPTGFAPRLDELSVLRALHDLAVGTELDDGIRPGVAAFVAEPRWILQPIASHDRPDVSTVGIDHDLADGAHRPAVRELRPAFDEAIRIRKDLRGDRRSATQRSDENERDHQSESLRASHTAPRGRDYT